MVRIERKNQSGMTVRSLLTAACLGAAMLLAGCDSSNPDMQAQVAANEAARQAASAGQLRATEKLESEAGGDPDALEKQVAQDLQRGGKDYLVQRAAADDLKDAVAKAQAAAGDATTPLVKSSLESQLGAIQLQLSQAKLADLQKEIESIAHEAAEVEKMAEMAVQFGTRAEVLEKSSKAPTSADVDKAKANLAAKQKVVEENQAKVRQLESDVAGKQSQAQKIYTDTDAAFKDAQGKKGQESIDAAKKAMDDRAQAEDLIAQADKMEPDLSQARAELALAQVEQRNAELLVKAATEAYNQANAAVQQTATQVKALRDTARKLVGDANGVTARFNKLSEAAAKLDAKIKDAAGDADKAAQNYNSAISDYRTYTDSLKEKLDPNLSSSDALVKISKDARMGALLAWSRSAALQQAGRVNLAGYEAATQVGLAANQTAAAQKITGSPGDARVALDASAYKGLAEGKFRSAVDAAQQADRIPPTDREVDRIKWLGFGFEALADHGLYVTTGSGADLNAAKAARKEADNRNPEIGEQLGWMGQ